MEREAKGIKGSGGAKEMAAFAASVKDSEG
jgi:hypothetical protein